MNNARISCFTPCAAIALLTMALLAGCASTKSSTSQSNQTAPTSTITTIKPGKPNARTVNIKADCAWKDETGYSGQMKLLATQSVVQDFSAAVNLPKHGSCSFALKDFRQIKETPNVELKGNASPCTVRMWTQGRQVSVAFSSCKSMCTGDVVDYLWPILADSSNGSCG
jgi:hypothetical protein